MSTGGTMSNCPNEEMLSAFIDGRLDEAARVRMIEHLADCADCRDVVLLADDLAAAGVIERADNVVRGRFRSSVMPAVLAAAAAMVVLLFITGFPERFLDGASMGALADAAETFKRRPTDARLNSDFAYKPKPSRLRSGGEANSPDDSQYGVVLIRAELLERQEKSGLSARDLHVLGVSELLLGKDDAAVDALEAAVKRATGSSEVRKAVAASEDVALLTDLVNAYVARNRKADHIVAAGAAERAWTLKRSATTAWNRALTLEQTEPADALAAWDDYLRIDDSSPWASEVPDRKQDLEERLLTGTSP